jgi:hypothetical protein
MLWFFQRGEEHLRNETTHDRQTGTFVLTLYRADGTQQAERFTDRIAFQTRLEALENELHAERWESRGSSLLERKEQTPH